ADWELIGVPHRLVIGERGLKDGKIEYQGRRDPEATLLPADSAAAAVAAKGRAALARRSPVLDEAEGRVGVECPVGD
ncbi:His/Gly/Thr/Pro-type tRNA ligase C-terminal domain-containing protein, partial [Burkholderia pseudomallei]